MISATCAKNTSPEVALRKALWHSGRRAYRLHHKKVPGRPDISFVSKRSRFLSMGASGIDVRNAVSNYLEQTRIFGRQSSKETRFVTSKKKSTWKTRMDRLDILGVRFEDWTKISYKRDQQRAFL